MSENPTPEQPTTPSGYDAPAPSYDQAPPAYQQPVEQQAPAYQGQPYAQQGYQQPAYGMAPGGEQKSKIVAGILGILLGSLGIHRFYLGYTKIGVIQIIVSVVTFGLGGLWGFIEGIMILVGADPFKTDVNGVPLKD